MSPPLKIGEQTLTVYPPELVDDLRRGRKPPPSHYPYGYARDASEITFEEWVTGFTFAQVSEPKSDADALAHPDRVYGVRVDDSEIRHLAKYPNVRRLEYTDAKATTLPEEIGDLKALRVLSLERNRKLAALPASLARMKRLEALSMVNLTALKDISVLAELKGLRFLELNDTTKLKDLSPLAALENLEELHLAQLPLRKLPPVLAQLPRLRRLSLYMSVRETTDLAGLAALPALEALSLEWAKTAGGATPAAAFAALQGLRRLSLGYSDFADCSALAHLKALESLDLGGSTLTALPAALAELPRLEYLSVARMKELSDVSVLARIPTLRRLDASSMTWETLPDAVGQARGLKELKLAHAERLTAIDAVAGLEELEVLDLSYLPLLTSPPTVLNQLPRLRVVEACSLRWDAGALGHHPRLDLISLGPGRSGPVPAALGAMRHLPEQNVLVFER